MHPPCHLCVELTQQRREVIKKLVTYLSVAKTVYDGNKKSLEGRKNKVLMFILPHVSPS